MSKRRFGLVLVLMFAVAIAAAALVEDFTFDGLMARERASADTLNQSLESAQTAIANLRGAQAAYFAVGQGPEFWPQRASDLSAGIEQTISRLQTTAPPAAAPHYDAALSALGGLNGLDQKVRDDLQNGAARLAADVIFSDANASAQALSTELAAAQREEAIAREARLSNLRRWRFRIEAAGVGTLLLVAFGLGLRRRQPVSAEAVTSVPAEPMVAPAPPAAVAEPAQSSPLDLSEAAQVCVDLARVLDGQDIPPLLERAARVLNAKGLVLWVADSSGALLRPSLAHGYSEKVLQRLGPLQADADNVTSLAFRSMQPQTLTDPARGSANALAVPLITSTGCIGVLAVELGRTAKDALPVARMFAAQLATLVAPTESSLEQAAQG